MDMRSLTKQLLILIAIVFLVLPSGTAKAQPVKGTFLYNLSNFTGTISYSWPRVFIDRGRNETYVLYQNFVKVFNETGMEVYSFGDELDLGAIVDIALDGDGNILLLSHRWSKSFDGIDYEMTRCNFRGEPISKIEVKGLPSQYSKILPNRMIYRGGNLYLASLGSMVVIVADGYGVFKEAYDILPLLELEEKEKLGVMMEGLSIDREGNFLFTIPPLFRAYKISPDRKVSYFGRAGSAPGKFNIVAGIVTDNKDNILVVDKLKCAVMIYDKNFNFLSQFGSRGWKPGFLIAPADIFTDNQDRVYVTQAGNKGISVFKMTYN
jgi:hypothetical protein